MTRAVHPGGPTELPDRAPGRPAPRAPRPYLIPVPDSLPPFDDELSPISRLRRLRRPGPTPRPTRPGSTTRAGSTAGASTAGVGTDRAGSANEQPPGLPPAGRTAQLLARALVEVFSGVRPHAQLRSHCTAEAFAELSAIPAGPTGTGRVRLLRVCEPAAGAAEVSVVYAAGARSRALAFRMEGAERRWRITALQVG